MRNLAKSFIERQTGLSGDRLLRLWRIVSIAGLMAGTNVLSYTVGCSLFVDRIGASGLSLSYVVVGLFASPLYVWFAKVFNRQAKPLLARQVLLLSALIFIALWSCLRLDSPVVYYIIYVYTYFQWTLQLDIVLPSLISDYYTSRDYNRYASWIVMAQALGGTIGGGFVSLTAGTIGTPGLLLCAVPLALFVCWRVSILEKTEAPIDIDPAERAAEARATQRKQRLRGQANASESEDATRPVGRRDIFLRYPIVRLLAASTFLWVILYSLAEYQYFEIYSLRFEDSLADLTTFLGGFSAFNSVMQLVTLYVATRALIEKLGVRKMAIFYPLMTLAGFTGLMVSPSFSFAIAMNFNSATIETAFNQPIHTLFYNPIPTRIVGTVRTLCDGFSYSSGLFVAGVLLLLTKAISLPLTGVAAIGVGLSGVYLFMRYRLSEEYFKTLVANLGDEDLDPDDVRAGFASIPPSRVEELLEQLRNGGADKQRQILQFLPYIKKPSRAVPAIEALIPDADRSLRQEIVNCWRECGDRDKNLASYLRASLHRPEPSLRAVALHACVVRGEPLSDAEVSNAIEQSERERESLSAYESIELETLAYLAAEMLPERHRSPELAERCDRFWDDLSHHTLDEASTAIATRLDIAIQAIRDTGDRALRDRLEEVLRSTQDADTIRKLFSALAELTLDRPDTEKQELAGMAAPYLGHPDARVRIGALELLGTLTLPDFWDAIAQGLEDFEFNVRPKAAAALKGYGEFKLADLEAFYLKSPRSEVAEAAVIAIAAIDTNNARQVLDRYLTPSFIEIEHLLELMQQVPMQRDEWQPVSLALANYCYELADRVLMVVYHLGDTTTQHTVKKVRSRLLDDRARERANAIEALASMNTYKSYIAPVLKILEFAPGKYSAPETEASDRELLDRLIDTGERWVCAAAILTSLNCGYGCPEAIAGTKDRIVKSIADSLETNGQRLDRVRYMFFLKTTMFQGLRLSDIWLVVQALEPQVLATGEILLNAGESGRGLYLLYRGLLHAEPPSPEVDGEDEDDKTIDPFTAMMATEPSSIEPGGFFGGAVLVGGLGSPCPVTISAKNESEVLLLSSANFRTVNETLPSLGLFVTQPCLAIEFDWY